MKREKESAREFSQLYILTSCKWKTHSGPLCVCVESAGTRFSHSCMPYQLSFNSPHQISFSSLNNSILPIRVSTHWETRPVSHIYKRHVSPPPCSHTHTHTHTCTVYIVNMFWSVSSKLFWGGHQRTKSSLMKIAFSSHALQLVFLSVTSTSPTKSDLNLSNNNIKNMWTCMWPN